MRDLFRQYFTKGFGFGAGFIAVLFTAGLLAVAVSTITTFTTGTPAKASEVNANFAALKTAIEGIPNWTKSGTTAVYSDGNVTINTTAATNSANLTVNGRISSSVLGVYCGAFNTSNGSLGGYTTVKSSCATACGNTNAHMCTNHEIVLGAQLGVTIPSNQYWISTGLYIEQGANTQNDCLGWTSSSSGNGARRWDSSSNSVTAAPCNLSALAACCL